VEGRGLIAIFGQHLKSKIKCAIVNVYATCNMKDEVALWEELTTMKSATQNVAWSFCGDFNAMRSSNERKGARESGSQKSEIIGFNNFIDRNFMVKLPIVGKKYMGYKANGSAKSRIDRVLVSDEWLQ